jgi:hypothetical protein
MQNHYKSLQFEHNPHSAAALLGGFCNGWVAVQLTLHINREKRRTMLGAIDLLQK